MILRRWVHLGGAACVVYLLACLASASAAVVPVVDEDVAHYRALLRSPIVERQIEGIQGLSHLKHWPSEDAIAAFVQPRGASNGAPAGAVLAREALQALTRLGTARSVPILIEALSSTDWELRDNARLALPRLTGHDCANCTPGQWRDWWAGSELANKQQQLLAIVQRRHTNAVRAAVAPTPLRRGRRVPLLPASMSSPACAERRQALRALSHLADARNEPALLSLLGEPQVPPLDADERDFICEAMERIGSTNAIPLLKRQRSDAAAWALARIGGPEAEEALLGFPPVPGTFLALDRLQATNVAAFIPVLVQNMAQITYRSHPDDVMNDELQPIQRVAVNLIRRSGLAGAFIEAVMQEIENTAKPPIAHGPAPACPSSWQPLMIRMRSELRPGFVREDGATTSQPMVTLCYLADDPALAARLVPLLNHPAFVIRVYVALTLGRLHAHEAFPAVAGIINEGYTFSDSTTLASGKHFDQSQTVRWKGFLCMALGRMGGDAARAELERYGADPSRPRDIRYSSVVGLRFIGSPKSLTVLQRVAEQDVIWMVRDEARRACESIGILSAETSSIQQAHR